MILSVFSIVSTTNSEYLKGDERVGFFFEQAAILRNTVINEVV